MLPKDFTKRQILTFSGLDLIGMFWMYCGCGSAFIFHGYGWGSSCFFQCRSVFGCFLNAYPDPASKSIVKIQKRLPMVLVQIYFLKFNKIIMITMQLPCIFSVFQFFLFFISWILIQKRKWMWIRIHSPAVHIL